MVDLIQAWRSASADKKLIVSAAILKNFESWTKRNGVAPDALDRETYLAMFAESALDGAEPRTFTRTDSEIRKWYRWAAREGLILNIPFGDLPLGGPPRRTTSITQAELLQLIDGAIRWSNDENPAAGNRLRSARAGLSAALVFYAGVGVQELSAMNVEVLDFLESQAPLPDPLTRAVKAYAMLRRAVQASDGNALFISDHAAAISGDENARRKARKTLTPRYDRLMGAKPFFEALKFAAEASNLILPQRFTVREILRLRSQSRHTFDPIELPSVAVSSTLVQLKVHSDWASDDVAALARIHPRFDPVV